MSYSFYNILHLGSLFALCLVLGALWGLYTTPSPDKKLRSLLLGLHGLLMFFIFLAGFGLIAKIKVPFPWPFWIYIKLAIWLLLGASPFLIKRAKQSTYQKFHLLTLFILFILFLAGPLIVTIGRI